jgi:hypothetical protein
MGRTRIPETICGSPDKPLKIIGVEIECYVLDDGRRVLAFAGLQRAIGLADGGSMTAGKNRLEDFARRDRIKQFLGPDALKKIERPFMIRVGSTKKYALEGEVLPALCDAVVEASAHGVLQPQQFEIAHRCIALQQALKKIAIDALIDEASGYQNVRDEQELQRLLEAYVRAEHNPYNVIVPDDFTREVCRVYGWPYRENKRLPRYAGKILRSTIYDQMPTPVLPALDERNPADANWQRQKKHHQFLTRDVGLPHFKTQLAGVMALLRASTNKKMFWDLFERAYGGQLTLDLPSPDI